MSSFDDMTGPKYRKIALNGRPLPDEKPQHTPETDQVKEESYIDALNLGLRHNTTDIYIPMVGDQLALTVRRNLGTEIINSKSGFTLDQRVDLPFGACWTSSVMPHMDLVSQQPTDGANHCLALQPNYATVIDETGSSYRFLEALVEGEIAFLPTPTNQLELDGFQATLVVEGDGLRFTKKFGTSIFLEGPVNILTIPSDRTDPKFAFTESHSYYRATRVEDRFGLGLDYTYGDETTLVPSQIMADTGQGIAFEVSGGRITSATDPVGNRTDYTYSEDTFELMSVNRPEGCVIEYGYVTNTEFDPVPAPTPTSFTHIDATSITTAGAAYVFEYQFDASKQIYNSQDGGYYTKVGEPMWVSQVTIPTGASVTLELDSLMTLLLGGFDFTGHRETKVTDAEGFQRNYTFTGISVVFLNNLDADLDIAAHGNPLRPPKMVLFDTMTVEHMGYGVETFTFVANTGMALGSVTDLCGNVTTFEYSDPLSVPAWANDYPVTNYDDPNVEARSLGATKYFSYGAYRVMSSVTDENGIVTSYDVDALGRRLSEIAGSLQETYFEYDAGFKAFLVSKTVLRIPDGAPTDASPSLVTQYVSDGAGQVAQEIHETGTEDLVTSHTYDANNNKLTTTDPRGNAISFEYDGLNRLVEVVYPPAGEPPVSSVKLMSYDPRGNKISETDENGFLTLFEYDGMNRMTSKRRLMDGVTPNDLLDLITLYEYNNVNSRTSMTDPRGATTLMTYDGLQRHLQTARPITGDVTTYLYDLGANTGSSAFDTSKFKPTSTVDPRGFTTIVEYDELYRPLLRWAEYQFAAGSDPALFAYSEMSYDPVGNLLQESHWLDGLAYDTAPPTDPSRIEFVQKAYDQLNRPTEVTTSLESSGSGLPPSTVTSYMAYTSTALKWQVTDELSRQAEVYYDGVGRAVKTISPLVDDGSGVLANAITQTSYDGNNNVIEKINPLGKIWQFQYDARNRKTAELQPGPTGAPPGPTIYHAYDPVGNAVSLTDANGNITTTTYDQANRPTVVQAPEVTGPDGVLAHPTTTHAYDKNGNVVSVTDPNGHETVNAYDAINRLTSTTDAASITVSYGYDLVDNRISVTDGLSQTTQFTYDGHKRNTSTIDPAGVPTLLAYDAINKISRTDPIGQVTLYAYDLRNHLLTMSYTGRSDDDRTYAYDFVGNLLAVTEAGHGGAADVAYTYDALNRAITETSGGFTHQYKYDLAGNRIYVEYGGTGRVLVSTYDELNRLSTLTEDSRVTTYTYDANGNVLTKALPNGETIATTYDALNRRTEITDPAYTYTQLYDLVGNLVQVQESYPANATLNRAVSNIYDAINRLTNETFSTLPLVLDGGEGIPPYYPAAATITSVTTYEYDAANNRTQRARDGVTTTYTYDNPLNQLSQWSDGTNTVTYAYDLNGNRLTRTEAGVTDTNGYDYDNRLVSTSKSGTDYAYTYDYRTRRVGRVEGASTTQIVFSGGTSIAEYDATATLQVEYIRGSDWGGGVGGMLYSIRSDVPSFTHCNSRGDVTTKTDGTGTVTWQAEYEAFGTHPDEIGSTLDRQKANTKEEDPTGLLNEGFRYRDLETGEFITRDPIGFKDGPNLYTYVHQNPWSKFDPEGLAQSEKEKELKATIERAEKLNHVGHSEAQYEQSLKAEGGKTGARMADRPGHNKPGGASAKQTHENAQSHGGGEQIKYGDGVIGHDGEGHYYWKDGQKVHVPNKEALGRQLKTLSESRTTIAKEAEGLLAKFGKNQKFSQRIAKLLRLGASEGAVVLGKLNSVAGIVAYAMSAAEGVNKYEESKAEGFSTSASVIRGIRKAFDMGNDSLISSLHPDLSPLYEGPHGEQLKERLYRRGFIDR